MSFSKKIMKFQCFCEKEPAVQIADGQKAGFPLDPPLVRIDVTVFSG